MLLDGSVVATITPSGARLCQLCDAEFSATAGPHKIEFLGLAPATADSTAFIDMVAVTPPRPRLADGSFETPVLTAGTWQSSPSGSPWQFSGVAGMSGNQSVFTAGNPNAPDGTQVAWIKDGGSISQSVLFTRGQLPGLFPSRPAPPITSRGRNRSRCWLAARSWRPSRPAAPPMPAM